MRLPVARWEYRIVPSGRGVQLVESVDDRRGAFLRRVSPWITGSRFAASGFCRAIELINFLIYNAAPRRTGG